MTSVRAGRSGTGVRRRRSGVTARQLQPGDAAGPGEAAGPSDHPGPGEASGVDALSAEVRRLAGVEQAEAALAAGALPEALSWPAGEMPLSAGTGVAGVEDLDELVGLLVGLVESGGCADDVERALDGVSRLCATPPPELEERTSALRAGAGGVLSAAAGGGMAFVSGEPRLDVAGVVVAWLDGVCPGPGPATTRTVGAFLSRRAREVAKRAARGDARVLLAAPTHRGGWIDAGVLAGRLEALAGGAGAADVADGVAAILRVHPSGDVEDVVGCLSGMDDEVAQAACYALGGPAHMVGPTAALWAAAGVVRTPDGRDPLVARQHPDLAPDVAFLTELRDPPAGADRPEVVWHGGYADDVRPSLRPSVAGWAATIRPGRLGWLFTKGCEALYHWREASMAGLAEMVAPAGDPDVSLGEPGTRMLMLALAAKDPDCRRLARDVLGAAIVDGRVDAAGLGAAVSGLLTHRAVDAARVAPALAGLAQRSPLHAEVVRLAVEAALHGEPAAPPAGLDALRALLEDLPSRRATAAAEAALQGRILRAQRWHADAASRPVTVRSSSQRS